MGVRLIGPASGAQSPPDGKSGFRRPLPAPVAPVPTAPPAAVTTPLTTPPSPTGRVRLLGPATQPTGLFSIGTAPPAPPPVIPKMKIGVDGPEIPVADIPKIEAEGDNSTRLLLAVEQRRQDPEKFGLSKKQTWGDYAADRLPFYANGLFDKAKAAKDAALGLDSPERMDENSIANLANVIVKQEFEDQEESQKGILQKGLDLATYIPGMGVEIGSTFGVGAGIKRAAVAGGKKTLKSILPVFVNQALQRANAKLAEYAVGRAAATGAGMVATSAIASQLNPFKSQAQVAERMLPTVQGDQIVPGESKADAYFNNSIDNTIEMFTEQLGVGVIGKAASLLKGSHIAGQVANKLKGMPGMAMATGVKAATAQWLAERAGLKVPDALKVLADKAKYHGLLGEMIEERYGEGLRVVADKFLETDIGDENGGASGNLGLAAYKALKGEYGAAADHLVGALGQLAVEGIGFAAAGGGMRAAGFVSKAGGIGYDHTEGYAKHWAEKNPDAAKALLQREPDSLSRSFFASIGLPATMGKEKRKEFAAWVEDSGQVWDQDNAPEDIEPYSVGEAVDINIDSGDPIKGEVVDVNSDGTAVAVYENDEGETFRVPIAARPKIDAAPEPVGVAPPVSTPGPSPVTAPQAPRKMPGGELKGRREIDQETMNSLLDFYTPEEISEMSPEEANKKAKAGYEPTDEDYDSIDYGNAATDRTPALQQSAQDLQAAYKRKAPQGEIDSLKERHSRLVAEQKPVKSYDALPQFTTDENAIDALKATRGRQKQPKETYWKVPSRDLKQGEEVGLRLDIPSYLKKNQWIVTVHEKRTGVSGGAGDLIGYDSHAAVDNASFIVPGKGSLKIAAGASKDTIATIEGKWSPQSDEDAKAEAEAAVASSNAGDGEWVQVGMDPERHGYFYSRHDMRPVYSADRVIQVGPLVLAKNPGYGDAMSPDVSYAGEGEPVPAVAPEKKKRAASWPRNLNLEQKRAWLRSLGPGGKELNKALLDEEVNAIGPQGAGVVAELYAKLKYLDPHLKTLVDIGKNAAGGYTEGFALVSELVGRETALLWGLLNSAFSAQNAVKKHSVAGLDLALRLKAFLDDPKNEGKNPTEEQAKAMFYETVKAVRAGNVATKSVHLPKSIEVIIKGYAATYYELRNESSSSVEHAVGKVPWFGLSSQGDPKGVVLDTYMARLLTPEVVGFKYVKGMQKEVEDENGKVIGYQTLSEAQQLKEAQKKWLSNDNNYIAYSARVRKLANKMNIKAGVAQEMIWSAVYGIIGLKNAKVENALEELKHEDVRAAWNLMSLILENKDVKHVLRSHGVGDDALTRLRSKANQITAAHRPVGLTGKTGARISKGFREFAKAIAPTGPTEGAEVAKRYRGEGGTESIAITLSASTSTINGLSILTDAARSGNDKAAIETLNGIARDSLEHLLGGIPDVVVKYDSNFGVYMEEGEPSLGVSITFGEENRKFVLAALARFAENFNQQEVHVRKEVDDFEGRTDYGDGSYSTVVHSVKLKDQLTIEEIKKIMEMSGLKGLTVNKKYLEAYYVGDVTDAAAIAEWEGRFTKVIESLEGRGGSHLRTVERLWVYGDTAGSISYQSIQGDVRPAKTGPVKTVARVAERHLGRRVTKSEQAKEITSEQDKLQTGIGDHYGAMPDNDLDNPDVRRAYEEAAKEIKEQFLELPIKVEAWVERDGGGWKAKGGEPYGSSTAMRADLLERNQMKFFATVPSQFGPEGVTYDNHPLLQDTGLTDSKGYPLLYNDLLRVVHDYYAHGLTETQFGPKGEEAAWRNHMAATKSPWAKWAITMETRGQNSWVNFRSGLDRSIPPKDRPFARQKVGLLPIKYSLTGDRNIDKGMREFISSLTPERRQGSLAESAKLDERGASAEPKSSLTKSGAFKKWFGDSKVVDESGNPLVLSHATKDDIDVFKSTGWGGIVGWFGSRKVTSEFAKSRFGWWKDMGKSWDQLRNTASGKMVEGVRIVPVYLSIKNPFDARFIPDVSPTSFNKNEFNEAADKVSDRLGVSREELIDSIPKTKHYAAVNQAYSYTPHIADLLGNTVAVAAMKAKGYDGFVTREFDEDVWVPFESTQVKSQLANNGDFDASKPSINEAAQAQPRKTLVKRPLIKATPGTQPETKDGKRLFNEQAKQGSAVGIRTITEFLADGMYALMELTKSQLTKSRPGKYVGGFRNKKGELVSSPFHIAFIRNTDGQIDFHELGHAMSSLFESVDPDQYSKWLAFWKDKLVELSNQGYSSVPDSVEEGVAEMFRIYMNEDARLESMKVTVGGKQKSLLDGLNELLSGINAPETAAIRDAKRLFDAHNAKPELEKVAIFNRDNGYKRPIGKKDVKQLGRDALTALFSNTVGVQGVLKDAMSQLIGIEQSGMGNVTMMLKMIPVVSRLFGIKEWQRKRIKEAVTKARDIIRELKKKGGDIEAAYNNVARIPLEVRRVVEGTDLKQPGLRVISGMKIDELRALAFELADAGLPVPGLAEAGEYIYITDNKTKEPIKLYHEIKTEVGEDKWDVFENYGQLKTIDARYRQVEGKQENWDRANDRGEAQGKRPKDYVYPEHRSRPIETVREMIRQLEEDNPSFKKSYKDVEMLMDGLLVVAVMSGEIPLKQAINIKNAYDHYWPLGRVQRGDVDFGESMKKLEIGYGIERAFGSELPFRRLDDIIYSRVNKAITAYNYGRMLDTATVFARGMAKLTPEFRDKVKWMQMFIPLSPDLEMMRVKPDQHRQILADYINDVEARKLGYANKEQMKDQDPEMMIKPEDVDLRGPGDVVLWNQTAPRMKNVIARKIGGEMKYLYVPDKFMLDIMTSGGTLAQSNAKMAAILGVIGAMTKPLSRVITRSLPFAAFNTFYRDPKTAMMTGQGKGAWVPMYYTYTALKAVIHGYTGNQTAAEKEATSEVFALWGQATSPMNAFGKSLTGVLREGITRDADGRKISYSPAEVGWPKVAQSVVGGAMSAILKPVDIANWASGGWWLSPKGEALTRMGAYIDARNRGETQEQAIMAADNSTANFNQRSSNPIFQMADKQAMFFNARMQVRWQFYRQLFHPDPSVRGAAYMKMMYSGALHAMILPAVVLSLKALGDDELDKWLEAWLKQEDERTDSDKARLGSIPLYNGLQFKIPFDDGPASMFDSIAFNTSLAWLAGAKSRGETLEQAAAGMYTRLMSFTGPGLSQLMNPVIRTAVESTINFEFYNNRRIVPDGIASIYEKKQQTTPSTPESWNQLAEWLDTYGIEASPMKIRHIVNNVGLKYVDQVAAWTDKKSPQELGNLPMLGQLFTKTPRGFSSQSVQSLSEMESKFDSAKKSLEKAAESSDQERANEAARMMISLQGYKAWHGTVMRQWKAAKKLRDAGRVDEAMAMEKMMTETARRGLKEAALQEAEYQKRQGG